MEDFLKALKAPLVSLLEKEVVKVAISNLIKSAFMLDFRVWLIKFIVDYLGEHVAKPAIDYFFQKIGYKYEVMEGNHVLKKVQSANNPGDWSSSVNRV